MSSIREFFVVLLFVGQRMSLTSHLRNPGSPVAAYLDGVSPWLTDTGGTSLEARTMAQALGLTGLASRQTLVPPLPGVDAARSGTAIDFRARIALRDFEPRDSVAAQGVSLLPGYADAVDNGAHRARVLAEAFDVAERIIDTPSDECELDRACLMLAHCEQVYRAGTPALAGSLGEALDAAEDGLTFAVGVDESSLSDIRALMRANAGQVEKWRSLIAGGERFEPNPSFVGSKLVGGADADWILGDVLIESKAYANLTVPALRGFIRQLLGYVMLDLDDAHGIRRVGIWLPRQGLTRTWSLDLLLGGDSDKLLPKLRGDFRTATEGSQLAVREPLTQRRKHQILADNRHTPHWMLGALALSEDVDIRFRVGRNAATPEEAVRKLARDWYAKVREGTARNENAPVDVLEELSHDRSICVRRAVVSNPRAPVRSAKTIGAGRAKQPLPEFEAPTESALTPGPSADAPIRIRQDRGPNALGAQWIAEFLAVVRDNAPWNQHSRIPLPKASQRWAREEGRSLDIPCWLKAGLPEEVKYDLMRGDRPTWVRRIVANDLPVSDPAVRERLLADPDPHIRWSTLSRTVDWPDDALAALLGHLAADRKERTRFRIEGDGLLAWERHQTPAEYDRETLSLVASHPSTPQAALTELLGSKTPDILIALVENPALPTADLASLLPRAMAIRSHELRERLAASSKLPATAALALSCDRNVEVRLALARNKAAPVEVLEKLRDDPKPSVRLAVAMNPGASTELAAAIVKPLLASSTDEDLLAALCVIDRHEDLDLPVKLLADALDRLSKSRVREPDMREVAARDERTGPGTLARLARSATDLVRGAVAANPSAPAKSLTMLASDSVSCVRASAAANTSLDLGLLTALVLDDEAEVRASAASNPSLDPALLAELLHDDEYCVRSAAFRNSSTRPEDRARAEAAWDRAWRQAAPSRTELEERIASKQAEVRMTVAFDPRTPADILTLLGGERRSAQVRRAVAANPNTPSETLASLADDKDEEVRQCVAFNRATAPEVLAELAGRSVDLALLVAFNPDTPISILNALSNDADRLVGHVATGVSSERAALTSSRANEDTPVILP